MYQLCFISPCRGLVPVNFIACRGDTNGTREVARLEEFNRVVDEVGAEEGVAAAARRNVDDDGVGQGAGLERAARNREVVDRVVSAPGTAGDATRVQVSGSLKKGLSVHMFPHRHTHAGGYSPAGMAALNELTWTFGRPPANADVVRMRKVRAPVWEDDAVNLIVVGLLTDLNWAIGNDEADEEPTVKVVGFQALMRESELNTA